jgi:hypothetical protein
MATHTVIPKTPLVIDTREYPAFTRPASAAPTRAAAPAARAVAPQVIPRRVPTTTAPAATASRPAIPARSPVAAPSPTSASAPTATPTPDPIAAGLAWARAEMAREERERAARRKPHRDPKLAGLGVVEPFEEEKRAAFTAERYVPSRVLGGCLLPAIQYLWIQDLQFQNGSTPRYCSPVPGPIPVILKSGPGIHRDGANDRARTAALHRPHPRLLR